MFNFLCVQQLNAALVYEMDGAGARAFAVYGLTLYALRSQKQTLKAILQLLETAVETKASQASVTTQGAVVTEIDGNVDDLITLSGVSENTTGLGTFTGSTISDGSTIKSAKSSTFSLLSFFKLIITSLKKLSY